MTTVTFDGGGFPQFTSYHDVHLPPHLAGSHVSDDAQMRHAFNDLKAALRRSKTWRSRFTAGQVAAIEEAMREDRFRIAGFTWHHHQDRGDGSLLQLVAREDHRHTHHYGGRFLSGGRP